MARLDPHGTVAESTKTLQAQQEGLVAGRRSLMLFPRGTTSLPLPKGMQALRTPDGLFHFNPRKISTGDIQRAIRQDKIGPLLGLGSVSKGEVARRVAAGEQPVAIVERDPHGTELRAAIGTHGTALQQLGEMQKGMSPGGKLGLEHPQHVIGQRLAAGGQVADAPAQSDAWAGVADPFGGTPAAPTAASGSAPASNDAWAGVSDPFSTAPAAAPAPSGGLGQTAHDAARAAASGGIDMVAKPVIGLLQYLAQPASPQAQGKQMKTLNGMPLEQPPQARNLYASPQAQQVGTDVATGLLHAQGTLAGTSTKLQGGMSPADQSALNASWNPLAKDSVLDHPLVRTALMKGAYASSSLLATLLPEGFAARIAGKGAAMLTGAAVNGGLGAGQVMSATSDVINSTPDTQLRKENPTYDQLRQTMGQDAAKLQLLKKMTGFAPVVVGAVTALTGAVSGGAAAQIATGTIQGAKASLVRRVASEAVPQGAAGAVQGGAQAIGAGQAQANTTGGKLDWHDVLYQSFVGALGGTTLGAFAGAVSRHGAVETAGDQHSAEGLATNHATHDDTANVPGEELERETDYDAEDHEGDEAGQAVPSAEAQAVGHALGAGEAAAPGGTEAEGVAPPAGEPGAAGTSPGAIEPPVAQPGAEVGHQAEPVAHEASNQQGTPGVTPKPYVAPDHWEEAEDTRVPVQSPAKVGNAARRIGTQAKAIIARDPALKDEHGIVEDIMSDLTQQAHDELPYHEGDVADMVTQFLGQKTLAERITEAVSAARQARLAHLDAAPEEAEAYGPEATDADEAKPQVRVRDDSLHQPGNEAALLQHINPDEDARTLQRRAQKMVDARGDAAPQVYRDILDSAGTRGGDNKTRAREIAAHRATERSYLQEQVATQERGRPPTEAELLQREPASGDEKPQQFWDRVSRAGQAADHAGLPLKRGSFLYRARRTLDDARAARGDDALPDRALTESMRGEEWEARGAEGNTEADHTEADHTVAVDNHEGDGDDDSSLHEYFSLNRPHDEDGIYHDSADGRDSRQYIRAHDDSLALSLAKMGGNGQLGNLHDELEQLINRLTNPVEVKEDPNAPPGWGSVGSGSRRDQAHAQAQAELARAIQKLGLKTTVVRSDRPLSYEPNAGGAFMAVSVDSSPHGIIHLSPGASDTVLLHEAVHAATFQGLRESHTFYGDVTELARHVRRELRTQNKLGPFTSYATSNPDEFLAHAMTDRYFQSVLRKIDLPEHLRVRTRSRLRDALSNLLGSIRKLLGLPWRDNDALSQALGAGFHAMRSGPELAQAMRAGDVDDRSGKVLTLFSRYGTSPEEMQNAPKSFGDRMAASIHAAAQHNGGMINAIRGGYLRFQSADTIAQWGKDLFHWGDETSLAKHSVEDPTRTAVQALSHAAHDAQTVADQYTPLLRKIASYQAKYGADEGAAFGDMLNHATSYDYDPSRAPNPKAAPKTAKGIQRLAQYQAGRKMFAALKPEGQRLVKEVFAEVRQIREQNTHQLMRNTVERHLVNQAQDTVRSGGAAVAPDAAHIDGITSRYMDGTEHEADKQEMGATHQLLAKQRRILAGSENYFSQYRYGKHVLTYEDTRPDEHHFANEADMQDFAKSTDLFIHRSGVTHYDAKGDEIDKDDPQAPAIARSDYVAHTQNHGMEMFASHKEAEVRRQELLATKKYKVSSVEPSNNSLAVKRALSPTQMETLRSALLKTGLDEDHRADLESALNEAAIRLLPGSQMRSGMIRRRNVMGASNDTLRNLHAHFYSGAAMLGQLRHAPEADNAIKAMRDTLKDQRYSGDNTTHVRAALLHQVELMRGSSALDRPGQTGVPQIVRRLQSIAFVKDMFTPRFNFVQAAQPYMTGLPYLQARYGDLKTLAEWRRTVARVGGKDILAEGGAQLGAAMKNIVTSGDLRGNKSYMDIIGQALHRNAQNASDHAEADKTLALIKRLNDDGIVDHGAGLQMGQILAGNERGVVRGLKFAEEAARSMPTAIEVYNRAMLASLTRKLELAKGGTEESAYQMARSLIKETQGDYSSGNTPTIMRGKLHPALAPAFTFRKYAQMIYSLLANHAYQALAGQSAEVRQVARRTLARTLLNHTLVAGMHGLPVGGAVMAAGILSLALGESEPWDYDTHIHSMLGELGLSPKAIDVLANGLPTLAGVNVTQNMGLESLVFDQLPQDNKISSWMSMLGETYAGAPGDLLATIPTMMQDIQNGRYTKAAETALPKVLADPLRALAMGQHGIQDNYGDAIVDKVPMHEVIAQALGFMPDAEEEAYSARDAGIGARNQYKSDRAAALDQFAAARKGGNMAQAQAALASFNKGLPQQSRITLGDALRATRPNNRNDEQVDGLGFTKRQRILAAPMQNYNVPQ